MLGIEDYGSDSETETTPTSPPVKFVSAPKPPPPTTKPRVPKKITIALPSISSKDDEDTKDDDESDRPAKKRKTGAGVSSLLSMLPAPKQSNPVSQPQRVLGSGSGPGLNFHTAPNVQSQSHHNPNVERESTDQEQVSKPEDQTPTASSSTLFRPTSLGKGKKNISLEESFTREPPPKPLSTPTAPAVDFFSLSSTDTSNMISTTSSHPITKISSAPELPTFEPPVPTPTDQYPGYYQLPSGKWAAYDAKYYQKFLIKWEAEYNAHVRALEKGTMKGFEGLQDAPVEEINAIKEMEKAKQEIQEREAKKALTQGAEGGPVAPRMNINASKTSGIARSRHQLSTLLKEAYENREALEERIAQGKRNRKEAGNKYGF